MVVRLFDYASWAEWKPGTGLLVGGLGAHRVVVDVNTTDVTHFTLVPADGPQASVYIGKVDGLDRLQFTAFPGDLLYATVKSDGDAVWYFTNEGDQIAVESAQKSFTRLAVRRERNPELELMLFKMRQNSERNTRLLAEQIAEMREDMAARAAAAGADEDGVIAEPVDGAPVVGVVGEAGGQPESAPAVVAPK